MKVIVFGASGMVGQGVLGECLRDPSVAEVLVVGRSPLGRAQEKLHQLVVPDVGQLAAVESALLGYDACFWCLGVSSVGRTEAEYRPVTYGLTVSAATTLARLNPGMTFVYVSGAGTDSTERGRTMWARVKGETENALLRLPFKGAYMFRPGIIRPVGGVRPKRSFRVLYTLLLPVVLLLRLVTPRSITTTERVGRAMIRVAQVGAAQHVLGPAEINALGT